MRGPKRGVLAGAAAALGVLGALTSAWYCHRDAAPETDLAAVASEFSHVSVPAPFAPDESWVVAHAEHGRRLHVERRKGDVMVVSWRKGVPESAEVRSAWTALVDPGDAKEWTRACTALASMIAAADSHWGTGEYGTAAQISSHCSQDTAQTPEGDVLVMASGATPRGGPGTRATVSWWWAAKVAEADRVRLVFELQAGQDDR